jgi:uncharacterized MnhB-related membrane protein
VTPDFFLDLALCSVLAGLAVTSLMAQDQFRSVVLFMTFGLVMALAWSRLGAPDIALVEAAIGSGLTGVLLLSSVQVIRDRKRGSENGTDEGE